MVEPMLNLLAKDFKLLFGKEKSVLKRVLSIIITIIFVGCFVAIEVFMFTAILKKISKFNNASVAFMNLFLAVISILIIISDLLRASKLLFDEKDIEQLSTRPVSNSSVILSKLIFLLINHYVTSIIFVYPLFVAYGTIVTKGVWFYYLAFFYPILSFLFEMGIGLLLVYPYYLLKRFLNKHLVVRFIVCIVVLGVGCFLYSKVLNVFTTLVASNSITSLFTTDSINRFIQMRKYEFPTNFLVDIFVEKSFKNIFPLLSISFGVFLIGCSIAIFAYNYVRNVAISGQTKKQEHRFKPISVNKALIKKELSIIGKNEGYTFSFTGLLIVQPFLAFLVIKSLNTIFRTGIFAYYISVVPNFIPLMDTLLLMLFTLTIASGASMYITMEAKTIKVIKTIPVKPVKQLWIKVLIPFVMSELSLIISLSVLLIGRVINGLTFGSSLVLVTILLIIYCLIALREELNIRHGKSRSTVRSNLYSYLLPIIYFIVTAALSYFRLNILLAYLIGLVTIIILGIPQLIYLVRKTNNLFLDLDMVN